MATQLAWTYDLDVNGLLIGHILAHFVSSVIFINLLMNIQLSEAELQDTSRELERPSRERAKVNNLISKKDFISDSDWDMSQLLGGDISDFDEDENGNDYTINFEDEDQEGHDL